MSTVKDIYSFLHIWAPFDSAMDGDNVGLLVGNEQAEVTKVGICLDITKSTVTQAKKAGCELIISHHPVIFSPLSCVTAGNIAYELASCGISAICAHTNLDAAKDGVNDTLAALLMLSDTTQLADPRCDGLPPIARLGALQNALTPREFAIYVKASLHCDAIKVLYGNKKVSRVGVCGGAGFDLFEAAKKQNADAFITSDIKHHEWLYAKESDITLIDAGHFITEHVITAPLYSKLSSQFKAVTFIILEESEPYEYI